MDLITLVVGIITGLGMGALGSFFMWIVVGPWLMKRKFFEALDEAFLDPKSANAKILGRFEDQMYKRMINKLKKNLEKAVTDTNSEEFKLLYNMTGTVFQVLDDLIIKVLSDEVEITDDEGNIIKVKQLPESFKLIGRLLVKHLQQSLGGYLGQIGKKLKGGQPNSGNAGISGIAGFLGKALGIDPNLIEVGAPIVEGMMKKKDGFQP
jgi:hypothetical protein